MAYLQLQTIDLTEDELELLSQKEIPIVDFLTKKICNGETHFSIQNYTSPVSK
tara:strand:- start:302 stop:460 length:159 start_codon:yes stop_codon:yes gene_type:complete